MNEGDNTYRYTYEYYLMKHFSHYVQSGAKLLPVSGGFTDILAFLNPDGQFVLIVYNKSDEETEKVFKVGDKCISLKLRPQAFNTIIIL